MEQGTTAIHTREQPDRVILQLHGTIDIFVAADLHARAKPLAAMGKDVHVSCALTDRLDTSAVQILLALQTELHIQGNRLVMTEVPPSVEKWIAYGGLANILLSH